MRLEGLKNRTIDWEKGKGFLFIPKACFFLGQRYFDKMIVITTKKHMVMSVWQPIHEAALKSTGCKNNVSRIDKLWSVTKSREEFPLCKDPGCLAYNDPGRWMCVTQWRKRGWPKFGSN